MTAQEILTQNGHALSRFTFGTMQFGDRATERDCHEMYEACRSAGINHFDTAHVYTGGLSETLLGKCAKHERESVVLASKVAYTGGAGRENILEQFDLSRRRIDTDYLDILYLHRFDAETPLEASLATFAELKSKQHIRYLGLSNFAAWQVMKAMAIGRAYDLEVTVLQPMYSLVKRQAEVEILPMAIDQNLTVCPYSPLGAGLLSGKYAEGGSGRLTEDKRYRARYGQDWMWQTAEALTGLARDLGHSPATLACAWAAAHPAAPRPILSARNVKQLLASLPSTLFDMSDTLYARISALSPTPAPATDRLEEQ